MFNKAGPLRVVEVSPSTVTINENGLSSTVSIDHLMLAPTPITVQDVISNANNGNKHELRTGAVWQDENLNQVADDIVNRKNTYSTYHDVDNVNEELAQRLHEPAMMTQ